MEYVGQKECEPLGDIEQEREGWRKRAIEVANDVIASPGQFAQNNINEIERNDVHYGERKTYSQKILDNLIYFM